MKGSSTVEFVTTETEAPTPPADAAGVVWPTFGYVAARTRAAPFSHAPPLRRVWTFRGRQLLEFPPAVAHGRLYVANNGGVLFAVNAATGRLAWKHESGRCVAASPAVTRDTVYLAFLNKPPCNATGRRLDGEVVAFSAGFGKVRWRARIGPTESSPLVANGLVYVGDWRGEGYAVGARPRAGGRGGRPGRSPAPASRRRRRGRSRRAARTPSGRSGRASAPCRSLRRRRRPRRRALGRSRCTAAC